MSAGTEQITLPSGLRRLIATAVAIAIPIAAWAAVGLALEPPRASEGLALAVFLGLAILAELRPVALDEHGRGSVSVAFVFILATLILLGWEAAVLVAMSSSFLAQVVEHRPFVRTAYNSSVYTLAAFAAGAPLLAIGAGSVSGHFAITATAMWSGAVFVVVNVVLVSLAISLHEQVPVRAMLAEEFRLAGPAFTIQAFLAALAAALWLTDPTLLVLMAGPLFTVTLYQRSSLASRIATRDAHTDSLTHIGNTRAFELALAEAVEHASATGTEVSLCVIDVDDFKQINDLYGHQAGDEALVQVSRLLSATGPSTRAYRLGGDEFALLVPSGSESAGAQLDDVFRGVAEMRLPQRYRLGLSAGVATYPAHAASAEQLEHMADGALYRAKHSGKDHFRVYDSGVARLYSTDELQRRAEQQVRLRAAENLVRVVDVKDDYTGAHSERVSLLVEGIARKLGITGELATQLKLAGRLHDVGKVAIPDDVLRKPSALTADELRQITTHSEFGASLLDGLDIRPVDLWIRHHHESWDGSGYPDGLRGEEIPLGSRIILVADAYDAITSDRSYRARLPHSEALAEIRRMAGTQFDPAVVDALEAHLRESAAHTPVPPGASRLQSELVA